jgi:cysteine desulfurase/selenocysteine lyase
MLAQRTGAKLRFIDVDDQQRWTWPPGRAAHRAHEAGLHRPRVQRAGDDQPRARDRGAGARRGRAHVRDGAQSAPHLPVDVPSLGCDFYAFSGHKMCGPTGTGGLWGRREVLEAMPPFHGGGDMIEWVELEQSTYAPLPNRFEAGTPHIGGAVGLGAAAEYLAGIGRGAILAHERMLLSYALERMAEIPDLTVYGPRDPAERSGVISFTLATCTRTTWGRSWTPRASPSAPATTAPSR